MSEIQFQQVNYNSDVSHDFYKHQLLKEFDSKVEIKIHITLNFRDDIPFILKEFANAVSGELIITSPSSFVMKGKHLFVDAIIDSVGSPFEAVSRQVAVNVAGAIETVKELHTYLYKYIKTDEVYVHWWYKTAHGIDSIRFTVEDTKVFRAEHYPFINDAPNFAQRFLESSASVLILLGDPGTGKTSLIRHILRTSGREAYATYDEQVMHDDCLYTDFLSGNAKFLILEDADLILADRQRDGNKVMSKILNAADGLVSFNDKKIIFTANIRDVNKIDEALLRPGRCFDVINFRSLKGEEIKKVCAVNGLEPRTRVEMSLAEIFN